jgi:hypothetical protein
MLVLNMRKQVKHGNFEFENLVERDTVMKSQKL